MIMHISFFGWEGSHRESGVSFHNLQLQLWFFFLMPKLSSMSRALKDGASIVALAAFYRARYANKLRLQFIVCDTNRCISMAPHIHEGNMGRQIGIRKRARLVDVSAF